MGAAKEAWDSLIRTEATEIADRENSCSACCGSYGKETWKDYAQDVRRHFETIGKAYVELLAEAAKRGSQ